MSKQLIHHSPLGPLEIPTVLGTPEPGESFDVDDDIAASLLEQRDLYELAGPPKPPTVAELKQLAADREVDITGLKKRSDIEAALAAADTEGDQQ